MPPCRARESRFRCRNARFACDSREHLGESGETKVGLPVRRQPDVIENRRRGCPLCLVCRVARSRQAPPGRQDSAARPPSRAEPPRGEPMHQFDDLEQRGVMCWRAEDQAWVADPQDVVQALTAGGFQEYRREIARGGRGRATSGGMWQGLDPRTGAVATMIWVAHGPPADSHVFIEIDGRHIEGSAWAEIDAAILDALATEGGRLTLPQIAKRTGMSEEAVRSVVSMLAEQGKVRIAAVELSGATVAAQAKRRPLPLSPPQRTDDSAAS